MAKSHASNVVIIGYDIDQSHTEYTLSPRSPLGESHFKIKVKKVGTLSETTKSIYQATIYCPSGVESDHFNENQRSVLHAALVK